MIDDMKNYKAPLGAFQLLTPEQCVILICALGVFALILEPVLR